MIDLWEAVVFSESIGLHALGEQGDGDVRTNHHRNPGIGALGLEGDCFQSVLGRRVDEQV